MTTEAGGTPGSASDTARQTGHSVTTGVLVRNASASRGGRLLWRGLDLEAKRGTLTAITGASGSGKSTLLHCIGQLERPDSGEVWLHDAPTATISERRRRRIRRDQIGFVFQDAALVDDTTVLDNVELVSATAAARRARAGRVPAALDAVGLGRRSSDPVHALSGGERQRVALARLLVKEPSIVLADEPTASLDIANEELVLDLLRGMADGGTTVLIATHARRVVDVCDAAVDIDRFVPKDGGRAY